MILNENYTLYNGVQIPKLALGTWQVSEEGAADAVVTALEAGYRHIDTATAYGNERGVGLGLKRSGLAREDVFLTTKVPAEIKSYEEAKAVVDASLEKLGTDWIDLMLIHAPRPWHEMYSGCTRNYYEENLAVWRALEEAYSEGKVRAIGVSNFEVADLKNIMDNAAVKPHANQIRVHIGHVPGEVMDFCRDNGILVMAYSPNATGRLLKAPFIMDMARKYGVSVSQLAVRYDLQIGTLPLPKSTHPEYIRENACVDFVISQEDMALLGQVDESSFW